MKKFLALLCAMLYMSTSHASEQFIGCGLPSLNGVVVSEVQLWKDMQGEAVCHDAAGIVEVVQRLYDKYDLDGAINEVNKQNLSVCFISGERLLHIGQMSKEDRFGRKVIVNLFLNKNHNCYFSPPIIK